MPVSYTHLDVYKRQLQDMLPRAYWLMDAGDYIMAAKQFHECAKNSTDSAVRNVSELKTVECLKLAGE